jgi:hypothetical protein
VRWEGFGNGTEPLLPNYCSSKSKEKIFATTTQLRSYSCCHVGDISTIQTANSEFSVSTSARKDWITHLSTQYERENCLQCSNENKNGTVDVAFYFLSVTCRHGLPACTTKNISAYMFIVTSFDETCSVCVTASLPLYIIWLANRTIPLSLIFST